VKEMCSLKIILQDINADARDGFYRMVTFLFYLICRIFFRVKIFGREKPLRWRKQHRLPFVVVARHQSHWDIPFLAVAFGSLLKTRLKYVAKNELKVFFQLIPLSNHFIIYINRDNPKKSDIEKTIKTLKDGNNIAIFPEGTTIPKNKKFFGGIILIIKKVEQMTGQEIPIFALNIKTKGPYGKPKGKWYYYPLRMVEAELRIGGPIFLRDLEEAIENKELANKEKRTLMVEELLRRVDQI
jgi:1-acyl-sn-glycerol-3-phosphate acyltransferase